MGETTFGKGRLQKVVPDLTGKGVHYASVACCRLPDGRQVEGRGIEPDVTVEREAVALDRLLLEVHEDGRANWEFEVEEDLVGGAAYDAHGAPLSDETMAKAQAVDAVLLGAVGGPKLEATKPSREQHVSPMARTLGDHVGSNSRSGQRQIADLEGRIRTEIARQPGSGAASVD